jgi:3-oxoacyl-[acyl-carrier protein] reductase
MSGTRLQNRIAMVTGAGAGIGRAAALRFAAEGAHVLAADIDQAKAQETAAMIAQAGGRAEAIQVDVSDSAAVEHIYAEVAAHYGRLDIQVSHAGIVYRTPFLTVSLEAFDKIIRTNLYGVLLCGQAAARIMMKNGGGRIVNTSSVSGQQGGTGRAAYGASKAAIINLTQTMAIELAQHNILVNAVAPGATQVERTAHGPAQRAAFLSRMAIQRYAEPADVASAMLFLCSDDNSYVTGHVLNVDGGFMAAGVVYDPATGEQPARKT